MAHGRLDADRSLVTIRLKAYAQMGSSHAFRDALLAAVMVATACTSLPADGPGDETYLRWVAFEVPINETVLLRWPKRKMPLRVFLPPPPGDMFEDPEAIFESVRDGVQDWAGVAGQGIPDFVFVDSMGEADVPIVWASEPEGDWYIAHCAHEIQPFARRFGVSRILVTARWGDGHVADLQDVYATVLHEHALGLGGHSPHPEDMMYESISRRPTTGPSARDRATLSLLYERPIGARIVGARIVGARRRQWR